jgi:hypothetical protein
VARAKSRAELDDLHLQLLYDLAEVEVGPLLITCVMQWRETGNAHFALRAIRLCAEHGIPVTGALLTEVAAAARALETNRSRGGRAKVDHMLARAGALHVMEVLRYHVRVDARSTLPVEEAAELARVWLWKAGYVRNGKPLFAAESLVKWYVVRGESHRFRVLDNQLRIAAHDDSNAPNFAGRLYAALKAGSRRSP